MIFKITRDLRPAEMGNGIRVYGTGGHKGFTPSTTASTGVIPVAVPYVSLQGGLESASIHQKSKAALASRPVVRFAKVVIRKRT